MSLIIVLCDDLLLTECVRALCDPKGRVHWIYRNKLTFRDWFHCGLLTARLYLIGAC